ncbi:hypothetical protein ROR02_22650 [Pararhodospirillum oryzae]|uniref:Uncharacterized protein n=1 Tax=Pararhodospirillum oryzae TaxID=478448 RepID=A0A512H9J4_9PROT|nr:hypothetical protein ROR02_22650 [Pararhodospirillum oryzae]
MNENSPIWARLADTVSAVPRPYPNMRTIAKAARDLPTTITSTTASTAKGSAHNSSGSNSIPTDTKNKTAKASFNGRESAAAW